MSVEDRTGRDRTGPCGGLGIATTRGGSGYGMEKTRSDIERGGEGEPAEGAEMI